MCRPLSKESDVGIAKVSVLESYNPTPLLLRRNSPGAPIRLKDPLTRANTGQQACLTVPLPDLERHATNKTQANSMMMIRCWYDCACTVRGPNKGPRKRNFSSWIFFCQSGARKPVEGMSCPHPPSVSVAVLLLNNLLVLLFN